MARIGIDARFFGPDEKGLGRYTAELVRHLSAIAPDDTFVLFVRRPLPEPFASLDNVLAVTADVRWYSVAEQLRMPGTLRRAACDLFHFPHFNVPLLAPTPFVVTVHDLILSKYPTVRASTLGPLRYWLKHAGYRFVIDRAVRRAARVIAVSQFTKDDLISHFRLPADRVSVTYEAAEPFPVERGEREDQAVLDRNGLRRSFLLFVGNAYPHKNLSRLLLAFSRLARAEPHDLVFVGRIDEFYRRLEREVDRLNLRDRIKFLGAVPDEDLPALYRRASLFVFPSLYEGFGLPPVEAMRYGLPVAAARGSALPEVLGPAAEYFNPEDVDDMMGTVARLLHDDRRRAELRSAGFARVRRFSWRRCAEETFAVYRSILSK